jgi:hypothetical protein
MSANPIVKTFEVFKNGLPRLLPGCETGAFHTLAFEGTEPE